MQVIDLHTIARSVQGSVELDDSGQPHMVRAPAPGCELDDDSLAIWLYAGNVIRVHCHRPEYSWQECQAYVRKQLGLPVWKPQRGKASPEAIERGHQKQSAKRKFIRAMRRKMRPSLSQRQPWKALGISERTWYRRGLHKGVAGNLPIATKFSLTKVTPHRVYESLSPRVYS